jgi:hypothetical protein
LAEAIIPANSKQRFMVRMKYYSIEPGFFQFNEKYIYKESIFADVWMVGKKF